MRLTSQLSVFKRAQARWNVAIVGAGEERRRHLNRERNCRSQIDDELELGGLHHRQIGWLGPFEDAASICPQAYIAWLAVSLRVFPLGVGGSR